MDNIINAAKSVYGNYFGFSGKANRGEFWWFVLFYVIVYAVLLALASVVDLFIYAAGLFVIASIIPYIAVGIRRLRDGGYNPLWYLLVLVPFGIFVLIYFWAQPSK
jgi:uncharacterized membrane protein YhaH (DUF805 family)